MSLLPIAALCNSELLVGEEFLDGARAAWGWRLHELLQHLAGSKGKWKTAGINHYSAQGGKIARAI